jgi:hypothetical protein
MSTTAVDDTLVKSRRQSPGEHLHGLITSHHPTSRVANTACPAAVMPPIVLGASTRCSNS